MNSQIISVDDNEIAEEDVWSVFNKKCEEAVSSDKKYIAVFLRSELGSGVPLLDWLAIWQETFQNNSKFLYVISNDKQQLESMELSSLDKSFNYFSSINEFESLTMEPSAASEEKSEIPTEKNDMEKTNEIEEVVQDGGGSFPHIKHVPQTIILVTGDTVEISGEYTCQSCNVSRMWMKGKVITPCSNPECFSPSKGWKLDFDLF